MDSQLTITVQRIEEKKLRARNGEEYWMGRDIQKALGYKEWRNFEGIIQKACMACDNSGVASKNHFVQTSKKVSAGSGAMVPRKDYCLTRYACYLIAMNGDANMSEVATAQTYFAVQTRRQEVQDMVIAEDRRLLLRDRVRKANKSLFSAAKESGVREFGVFQGAGYLGLYDMNVADIKKRKDIPQTDELLDRADRLELAANEFRITQTEDKLKRDRINSEKLAKSVHYEVGREVRQAISKVGGTMPEDLPAAPHIRVIERKRNREHKMIPEGTGDNESQ